MSSLNTLIGRLYPESKSEILQRIDDLIKRYDLDTAEIKLSEKDVILITYGDSIFKDGEAPLQTLKQFCDSYLRDSISAVHLLPCFPYSSDDGFSVIDYYEVNPDLGDWEDIEQLAEHFDLMFDAVVNHMSKHSSWFKSFLNGEDPYHDYFVTADIHQDYSQVVRPRALPLLHEYTAKSGMKTVWTTFSEDQVDLNYKNKEVFLQVLDILLFYVSKGARFIRLDAIAFLWKELGTTCIHLPETHMVIQAYRNVLEMVAPSTVLITETNVPHKENISYFGDGFNEAHMVYNFTLPPLLALSLHQENVDTLLQWAKSLVQTGNTCFFNFTASHDGVGVRPLKGIVTPSEIQVLADKALEHGGFVSYKDNGDDTQSPYELNCNYLDLLTHPAAEDTLRTKRFLLTQSVMLCMPGIPGVYYHSILGSQNDRQAATDSGINRRINRKKLDIKMLNDTFKNKEVLESQVFTTYTKMLKARRQEALFDPYGTAAYHAENNVFIFERLRGNFKLLCLHNFSSKTVKVKIDSGATKILFNSQSNAIGCVGAFDFQWIVIQNQ
ncbi:MAG: alpha-amylase family glycosyl hydrolase [Croceivirga sp.]